MPGGLSLPFSLIPTQCHALSTYSMCPFHTNSTQKWSSHRAQLGPHSCYLIDERKGGRGRREGWRRERKEEQIGREIRYTEIQASNLRIRSEMLSSNNKHSTHISVHSQVYLEDKQVDSVVHYFGSDPRTSSTSWCCLTEPASGAGLTNPSTIDGSGVNY